MISAQVTNNNYASVARYNAHTEVAARASTRPFGAIPGLASLNVCGDLRVCNYQNLTTDHFLARQLSPLADGVMAELINANWPALDTSGTGEGTIYAPGAQVAQDQALGVSPLQRRRPVELLGDHLQV